MLAHTHRLLAPADSAVLLKKDLFTWYSISANVVFLTEQFREFQMSIIQEALWQMQEVLDDEALVFEDAIAQVELILQEANSKLLSFAEKMTSVDYFDIRGIITVSQHNAFVSAVIGDVGLIVERKGHLVYTMQNDSDTRQKISLFSDIIEWDLSRDDTMYFLGTHFEWIFDRDEIETLIKKIDWMDKWEQLEQWVKNMLIRVPAEKVGIVSQFFLDRSTSYSFMPKFSLKWRSIPIPSFVTSAWDKARAVWRKTTGSIWEKMQNKEFIILAILIGVFLVFVLWGLVSTWIKNTATNTIQSDGTVTAPLSIDDIKKEIAEFQKLDAASEEKWIKYNTILSELDRIKAEWKWADDVAQLKKILDTEYLQWFNIIMLDSLEQEKIYTFSSLELSTIWTPLQLFFRKWLYIAGTQWGILWWVSSDVRWTAVRSIINNDFKLCSLNLLRNGIYCATTKNTIFNITKWGVESVGGDTVVFPWSIQGIDRYGSSSMYLLTDDPAFTKDKTYIIRYTNAVGSQNAFATSMTLPLIPTDNDGFSSAGFSSVAIDWTFLVWSKSEKALYQLYRQQSDKALSSRQVPLVWGTTIGEGYSDNVKIITDASTRFVYLYDRTNKTVSVYNSTPTKTSEGINASYKLNYQMRLDLSNVPATILDVMVDESDGKKTAYILLKDAVAKISLSDFLDSLEVAK